MDENGLFMDLKKVENIDYSDVRGIACYRQGKVYEFFHDKVNIRRFNTKNGEKLLQIEQTVSRPTQFSYNAMSSCVYNKTNDVFIVASYNHIATLNLNNFTIKDEINTNYVPELVSYGNDLLVTGSNSVNIATIGTITNIPVYTTISMNNRQLAVFNPMTEVKGLLKDIASEIKTISTKVATQEALLKEYKKQSKIVDNVAESLLSSNNKTLNTLLKIVFGK